MADAWLATPAEIRDVKYGLVHETDTGFGGVDEKLSASKKVSLVVEPPGSPNVAAACHELGWRRGRHDRRA